MCKNKKIHFFVFIVLVMMISVALTACRRDNDGNGAGAYTPPGVAPAIADGEQITITIGINAHISAEDHNTNWKTLYIQETTGVNLEFDVFPAAVADARTSFTLLVAAGERLPDVTVLPFLESHIWEFAQMGIFVPITDWWNDPEISPNVWAMDPEDRVAVTQMLTLIDGNIYTIPAWANNFWNEAIFRAWINHEWLDSLGMDAPLTTNEFRNVLYAFVHQDPDGNGLNDTIGVAGAPIGWGTHVIPFIMNAFIYANPDTQWLHIEDGIIFSSLTRPEFWEGMEFIHSLVQDGLIDIGSFTQSAAELTAIAQQEEALAGVITAASYAGIFGGAVTPFKERMQLMVPLTGPHGVNYTGRNVNMPGNHGWQITRYAAHPLEAYRIGEMFMSDYWALVRHHGQHGVHWFTDPDIFEDWVGEFLPVPTTYVVCPVTNPWGRPGNTIWGVGPGFYSWPLVRGRGFMLREDFEAFGRESSWKLHYELYPPRFPSQTIGRRLYTEAEMEELAMMQPLLEAHMSSMLAEFAVGNRPLSEANAFLQELEGFGLSRFIQLSQNGHNRNLGLPIPY